MQALPFGLGPSCAVFSNIITALAASWRRMPIHGRLLRLVSYVDDFLVSCRSTRDSIRAAIEFLYEFAACGFIIAPHKCHLAGAPAVIFLNTIIDSLTHTFNPNPNPNPAARIECLRVQLHESNSPRQRHVRTGCQQNS